MDFAEFFKEEIRQVVAEEFERRAQVQPEKKEEKLLTTNEAIKFLRVSKPTLHRWKTAGAIPHVRIGGTIRYKESDLRRVLEK